MKNIVPKFSSNLSKMWNKVLNLENCLFPELQEQLGTLSTKEEKLIKILDFAQIEKNITVVKITNTPNDRIEIARAMIAKSVYNIQTTRDLIDRIHSDRVLRVLCGWRYKTDIPSEPKFSRVFKELSKLEIAQKTHEKFVKEYLSDTVFLYNASDATKIPLREKPVKVEKKSKPKVKRGRPKKGEKREPIKPKILEQQKNMKTTDEMLSLVSTDCAVGIKQNSKGNREVWIGGKLHISAVDGDIPVTAFYSGANVHDSSVALPLINETSKRVMYLHDLQDAGYDSDIIREFSKKLNHKPIIDINPKNSKELKQKIQLLKDEKEKFEWLNLQQSSDIHHYNQRSMVERVNKYLKDDFGCNTIYYQGSQKVASVLAFGILSVCIHQSLKLIT
ncbi:transposase [Poseidonibacter ostreae]|uniref:Transposase n=3 Tax=Poseidonibacter ostreae TaxID=2654171 RepID=A0ABQ6VMQ1_9BACT|nr:transposase [Poseidonibacter ostreae]KAB7880566.1 transposase [Poseidonibacter ostreae]KAB7885617.1 transposase [Poseidonibacter ostreae]